MKKTVLAVGLAVALLAIAATPKPMPTGPTITVDSLLEKYYAPIQDTVIYEGQPPATRMYVYTTYDMLYRVCTIGWQLAYVNDGNVNILRTGQVTMNGNYYAAYVADNRNIVHLFNYAGNYIGITFN